MLITDGILCLQINLHEAKPFQINEIKYMTKIFYLNSYTSDAKLFI